MPVPAPRPGPSSAPAAKGQGPVIAVFAVAALAVLAAAYLLFLSPFRPFTLFGDAGSRQADSAGSSTPTGVVVVVATGGASPAAVSPTSVTPATATAGSVAPTAIVAPTAVPVALPTAAPARAPTVPPVPAFTLAGQWKGTMIANSVVLDIPSVDPEEVEKFQEELETLKGQEVAVVIEFRPQSPTAGSIAATVAQPDGSQSREQGTYRYENGQVTITSDNESDATHMSMKGRVSEGGLLAKIEGTWRSVSPITDSDTGEEIGSIESEGTWAISRPN